MKRSLVKVKCMASYEPLFRFTFRSKSPNLKQQYICTMKGENNWILSELINRQEIDLTTWISKIVFLIASKKFKCSVSIEGQ